MNRREAEVAATEELVSPRGSTDGRTTEWPAAQTNGDRRVSASPSGFTAVNARLTEPPGLTNGVAASSTSAAIRNELLSKFTTNSERTSYLQDPDLSRRPSQNNLKLGTNAARSKPKADGDYTTPLVSAGSPGAVPIPNTPSSLLPYTKPSVSDRLDDSGPYKAEMVNRMEQLQRGDRIQPPCDRCRRLHMDCQKNLTACIGCTKKHAKCGWKDVVEEELKNYVPPVRLAGGDHGGVGSDGEDPAGAEDHLSVTPKDPKEGQAVDDAELLGEDGEESDEGSGATTSAAGGTVHAEPISDPPQSIEGPSELAQARDRFSSERLSSEHASSAERRSSERLVPEQQQQQVTPTDLYHASSIPSPPLTTSHQPLPPFRPASPLPAPAQAHNLSTPPMSDYGLPPSGVLNGIINLPLPQKPSYDERKPASSLPPLGDRPIEAARPRDLDGLDQRLSPRDTLDKMMKLEDDGRLRDRDPEPPKPHGWAAFQSTGRDRGLWS